ncbi:MAG: formate dehydrogenase subunit alpha, partial [Anaerolineae bacterium]|nr:formate dehydrogenase subunit alpha [Anaerolineae bacterium]
IPDWQIISQLAARLDAKMARERDAEYWRYDSASAIFEELARVTPIYSGMNYDRLRGEGLQWPCRTVDHPGTPILHIDKFSRGRGKFHPITAHDPAEQPDADYPLVLTTGRVLYHYHTGTMTRRSEPLAWREPRGYVEINAEDAERISLEDGHAVVVKSRRGSVRTRAKISDRVPPGTVFLAFHWREAPANMLTQDFALDPVAKIPEYKVCAVRVENPRA